MVTFYICYVVFLFFPVAGPRYTFEPAHNAATSVWPARATQWLLDLGDSWGAAFPSSHVAAAVVAALCALRYRSEEHTSELQSQSNLVCRLLLEKKTDG